jgi:hypothetical protein
MSLPQGIMSTAMRVSVLPKRYVGLLLMGVLAWLRGHPELKSHAVRILQWIPPLERRLSRFANAKGQGPLLPSLSSVWAIDADPDVVLEWKNIADEALRISGAHQK